MQTLRVIAKVEIKLFIMPDGSIGHTLETTGETWSVKRTVRLALLALLKHL